MKSFAVTLALTLAALLAPRLSADDYSPKSVLLWPDGAPGAKGTAPGDVPRLEVYCAPDDPCGASIVICPGGGYGGLAVDHEGKQIAQYFNSLGVSAFVLHYRHGGNGYHHPIPLNDAKRALRWVRDHTEEYHLDPNRIGIIGFSAGGHLASTAGTLFDQGNPESPDEIERCSSRPDFMILCYPVISFIDSFSHKGSRNNLLGPAHQSDDALARQLSSQHNVTAGTPPTFIFQTDEDLVVPAENAVSFYLALRQNKVPAEMHVYQHGPHGVGLMHGDPILSTWSKHLTAWLRNNAILGPTARAAITGQVTINGTPVRWGSVTFEPEDKRLPIVSARVRSGKFSLKAAEGAPIGKHRLKVLFSAADVPSLTPKQAPAGVAETTKANPDSPDELFFEVKDGPNELKLELLWPAQDNP